MSTTGKASAQRSPTSRSAVSNGSQLLAGIDGRSAAARRYRDLCQSIADDLGGAASLTEAQQALVRQAAGVTIAAEKMQAAIIRDEAVDHDEMVRVSNALTRLMTSINAKTAAKAVEELPSLASYLAGRQTVGAT